MVQQESKRIRHHFGRTTNGRVPQTPKVRDFGVNSANNFCQMQSLEKADGHIVIIIRIQLHHRIIKPTSPSICLRFNNTAVQSQWKPKSVIAKHTQDFIQTERSFLTTKSKIYNKLSFPR